MSETTDEIFNTQFYTHERDREGDNNHLIYVKADSFMAELSDEINRLQAENNRLQVNIEHQEDHIQCLEHFRWAWCAKELPDKYESVVLKYTYRDGSYNMLQGFWGDDGAWWSDPFDEPSTIIANQERVTQWLKSPNPMKEE